MDGRRPSKKQRELLSFIDGFIKGYGYGPSYREIMRALNYKSVSTVAVHVDGLIGKGLLVKRDKSARSLVVVAAQPSQPSPSQAHEEWLEARVSQLLSGEVVDSEKEAILNALRVLGFDSMVDRFK